MSGEKSNPPTMPVPIPVPASRRRQPAKRSSSSSSSTGSSSGRRHASSPPASRPASRPRYSPPQPKTGSSTSPGAGSPLAQLNEDAVRMPPPPPPPPPPQAAPRAASLRNKNRVAANDAPPRRTGRTPSVSAAAAAASGRAKTEEEKLALATAASKSLGSVLGVGAAAGGVRPSLKSSTSDPAKLGKVLSRSRAATVDKASLPPAADGAFGRAMSLRSRAGKGEGTTTTTTNTTAMATTRTRAGTGTGTGKQRPASVYGATSKQDLAGMGTAASGIRRPSTSSLTTNATTSMPPPPPPAAKGHRRSASGVNATIAANATTSTTATTAPIGISASSRPTTAGSTKTKRPAFSALTQDFTVPANPNPPSSPRSRFVPPPPLDTPTLHAQTQLLQLLTLRSSSAAVYQQLIASATATLKARFEQLSARHYDARETSAKKQKRHNIDSLAAVVGSAPGRSRRESTNTPEQRVQAFSEAIKRIDAMRSGEFRGLCTAFGDWIAGYNPRAGSGGREKWIDGIGEAWRRECVGVCRRLEAGIVGVDGVAGVLAAHGEVEALVTTVSRVAEGYRDLAEGMLEEAEMMGRMEVEVVERERMQMGRRVQAILEGVGAENAYTGQGIWAGC